MSGSPISGAPGYTLPPGPPRPAGAGTVYPSAGSRSGSGIPPSTPGRYGEQSHTNRPQGTIYGGSDATRHYPATFIPPSPLETSGSLTGHILNQGGVYAPPPKARTAKVIIILILVLILLVAGGLVVATIANNAVTELLEGLFK